MIYLYMKINVKVPTWIKEYSQEIKKSFAALGSMGSIVVIGVVLTLVLAVFMISFISAKDKKEYEDIQNQIKMQKEYQQMLDSYNLDMDATAMLTRNADVLDSNGNVLGSFTLEIADNDVTRTTGLSGRETLAENQGMLFQFAEETTGGFHMKDVKFPLDMIFLDENSQIIEMYKSVPPCETDDCEVYSPTNGYYSVVEVLGGTVDKLGVKEGDTLRVNNE